MNRIKRAMTVIMAGSLTLGFNAELFAEYEAGQSMLDDIPVSVSADTAVYTKYIWRGFKLDDDPVMQPGVYVSVYGIEASVWGSFDIDSDDGLDSDEVDYTIGYSLSLEDYIKVPVSVSGGYTYYDFPAADLNSQEFYVGASLNTILSPSITWYHDFEDEENGGGDGDYILAELSHSFPLGDYPISLDLGSHVGYNNELFILGEGGDVGLDAGLTFTLSKNCTFTPSAHYSIPFGDLEDTDDGNQDDEFYAGVVLAFNL
jgi:hypothetical protein